MVGVAGVIVIVMLAVAIFTDFPGPSPAGENPDKSTAPPEDVRRVEP